MFGGMSMRKPKLIVCDVDMTLKWIAEFPDINRSAIEAIRKEGIYFGLASGRDVDEVRRDPESWGMEGGFELFIGINGCQVYDNIDKRRDDIGCIPYEDCLMIMNHMKQFSQNLDFYVEGNTQYSPNRNEHTLDAQRRARVRGGTYEFIDSVEEIKDKKVMKMLFRFFDEEEMNRVLEYCEKNPLENYNAFRTNPVAFEFQSKKATKGTGVQLFCQRHNIALDEVIAFGDSENDAEMIEQSYGVVLKNGTPAVKAIAKEITDLECLEGGFGDWIFKHLLTKE